MAIQWADDFSRYGTGTNSRLRMLEGLPYAVIGSATGVGQVSASPDPTDTGLAFRLANGAFNVISSAFRIALPTVVSGTVGICFRAWFGSLPDTSAARPRIIGTCRADNSYLAYLQVEQNGALTVIGRVSGVDTQLATTGNPVIQPSSFNHYEFIHNRSAGTGSVYVNGVQQLTFTGVDTADNIVFAAFSPSSSTGSFITNTWIKDLVIWDSTGSQNNSQMGTVIVRSIRPDGDVGLGDWTPSTGTTGFNLLAKTTPNDATYLSASDTPMPSAAMQFTMSNLPPDITSVRGLVPVIRVRKIDGGDAQVQAGVSPNGTNWDDGANRPITSAFTYYFDVSELNPATGTAWTPATVDSSETRIDRTV